MIEKRENGKVHIIKKHETPTRVGGGSAVVLAGDREVVALFPFAAIGGRACWRQRQPVVRSWLGCDSRLPDESQRTLKDRISR